MITIQKILKDDEINKGLLSETKHIIDMKTLAPGLQTDPPGIVRMRYKWYMPYNSSTV